MLKKAENTEPPPPQNICTRLKGFVFPDREEMTRKQIAKFDEVIKNFQKQLSMKESEAHKLRCNLMDIRTGTIELQGITSEEMESTLSDKIRLLLAEIKMRRQYMYIFQNAKLRLETIQNSALVTNELSNLNKHYKEFDFDGIQNLSGIISDMDHDMNKLNVKVSTVSKNLWTTNEDELEDEFNKYLRAYKPITPGPETPATPPTPTIAFTPGENKTRFKPKILKKYEEAEPV